jgi:nitroreductase
MHTKAGKNMNLLEAINTRASAIRLDKPAPSREQMNKILEAAAHAPDHGKLAPWRFIVLENDSRNILGKAMVDSMKAKMPTASDQDLVRERAKVDRAPVIVTVAAKTVDKGDSIPQIEQVLAAGAAAQNIFLAAHALGFGAMWKTGTPAYDTTVKTALGLAPEDHIIGFLYIGSVVKAGQVRTPNMEGRIQYL